MAAGSAVRRFSNLSSLWSALVLFVLFMLFLVFENLMFLVKYTGATKKMYAHDLYSSLVIGIYDYNFSTVYSFLKSVYFFGILCTMLYSVYWLLTCKLNQLGCPCQFKRITTVIFPFWKVIAYILPLSLLPVPPDLQSVCRVTRHTALPFTCPLPLSVNGKVFPRPQAGFPGRQCLSNLCPAATYR